MKNLFEEVSGRLSLIAFLQGVLFLAPNIKYVVLKVTVIILCLYVLFLVSASILEKCNESLKKDYYAFQIKWVIIILYSISVIYFPIFFTFRSGFVFMSLLLLFFLSRTEPNYFEMYNRDQERINTYKSGQKIRRVLGYIFLFSALFYFLINVFRYNSMIINILTKESFN